MSTQHDDPNAHPAQSDGPLMEDDKRITLAFENLSTVPSSLLNNFSRYVKVLDLSHNNFSDLSFLKHFVVLTSLILDHNRVNSSTTFPTIPSLKILWLNHNDISMLFPFIQRLRVAFPNLEFLSLMANEAVPVNVDETTYYQHLQYRLFVISWFSNLKHLDDQVVTPGERSEAYRLYKRPLLERIANNEPFSKVVKTVISVLGFDQKRDSSGRCRSSFV